jgi:hypothetical protein
MCYLLQEQNLKLKDVLDLLKSASVKHHYVNYRENEFYASSLEDDKKLPPFRFIYLEFRETKEVVNILYVFITREMLIKLIKMRAWI